MNLREYERLKFELADLLRAGAAAARKGGGVDEEWLRELFVRLAEDRFNLVVVGRFSRGKTSLMNAILGTTRLPIGMVPVTSVITTVAYGSRERLTIHYEDDRLPSEVALDVLPEYVTQGRNPGNVRRVRTAEVQLPAEILRRGFHLIDTPGLGSPVLENTRTTESFLPKADAVVLVTSYESPLSAEELRVLGEACSSGRRGFVVLNKEDTVPQAERAEVLRYARDQLDAAFGAGSPCMFSLSAREAQEARRTGDRARLERSGIERFEAELVRFLLAERKTQFLLRLCDRAEDLLCSVPPAADVASVSESIRALARRIVDLSPSMAVPLAGPGEKPEDHEARWQLRPCEVCARMLQAAFDFLSRYQYDLSVRLQLQRRHAANGGLCSLHTWQYASLASPHGVATGYPSLLEHFAERLRVAADDHYSELAPSSLSALLPTAETCLVCRLSVDAQADAIGALGKELVGERDARIALRSALCLPHVLMLVATTREPSLARDVLQRHAAVLDRLAEDMRRYATKHDAIRRSLATEEEIGAASRALSFVAGLRNLNRAATAS